MPINPNDYFTEIDLNPAAAAGGPVMAPVDRRAMHYFGFVANGQQIVLLDPLPQGSHVLFSFVYANQPGVGPVANDVQAHGALDFFGPNAQSARYEGSHDRAHVLLWLDVAPPAGQQVRVRVSAWRRDQSSS